MPGEENERKKFWPPKSELPPRLPDPEPLEDYDVPLIIFGTALWAVAGVVLFAMHDTLEEHDRGWWPYSTIVGFALGLLGIRIVRRRRVRRRARAAAGADPAGARTGAQPAGPAPSADEPRTAG